MEKKSPYTSYFLDTYKLRVPIISNVHVSDFEHDGTRFVQGRKEGEPDYLETLLEADDPKKLDYEVARAKLKLRGIIDAIAFLQNKGVRLGFAMVMRGEKHMLPSGEEHIVFRGWGQEEVMLSEQTLRNEVVPLYENLKSIDLGLRRCLTWFNIGLCEHDKVDEFLAYWISLEAISSLHSTRDCDIISEPCVKHALEELQKLSNNDIKSQIVQRVIETARYKSIQEAMADEIRKIIGTNQIASILSILNEKDLEKALRVLARDRAQIAHGKQREIIDLEKKAIFLHDVVHAILEKSLLQV